MTPARLVLYQEGSYSTMCASCSTFSPLPTRPISHRSHSFSMQRGPSIGSSGSTYLRSWGDLLSLFFISWIKILYASPTSSVRTNSINSNYFPLHRGQCQGCCLFLFLFIRVITPPAIFLRMEQSIKGIVRNEETHKVSLFELHKRTRTFTTITSNCC